MENLRPECQYLVLDGDLLNQLLTLLPQPIKRRVESEAQPLASTLFITQQDLARIVREVASDLNFNLNGEAVKFVLQQLLTARIDANYLKQQIEDLIAEDAAETLHDLPDYLVN